jgi:RHS repeat-associated protein
VPPHSTGKEHDAESGNDYFIARYYSSAMGRFMSPDFNGENDEIKPVPYANLEDPQGLNQYAYAGNNPLTIIDPDGHCGQTTTFTTSFPGFPTQTSTVVDRSDCQKGLNALEGNAYRQAQQNMHQIGNWWHGQHWIPPFLGGAPDHSCDNHACDNLPIQNAEIPWGMVGGLGGVSGLFSGAERNALNGVLKGIANGTNKGAEFENFAAKASGWAKPLPAQAAGYYRRYVVSLGAGKGAFRLVTGLGGEMYATFDHYVSWVKIR